MEPSQLPDIFQVEITSHCTLRCAFCPYPQMTRPKMHMGLENFRARILPYITGPRVGETKEIGLYMMGEPLLHPQYFEFQEDVRRKAPRLAVEIATNGTQFARPPVMLGLLDKPPNYMILDVTPWKERGEVMQSVIDRVYEFARRAVPIWRVAHERGYLGFLPKVAFQVVQRVGMNDDLPRSLKALAAAHPEVIQLKYKFLDTWAGQLPELAKSSTVLPPAERTPCEEPFRRVAVTVEGDVVPCCRDAHALTKYGNLFQSTLEEIWQGPVVQSVREKMLAGRWEELPEPCRSCRESHIRMSRHQNTEYPE